MIAPELTPLQPWPGCDERSAQRLTLSIPCTVTSNGTGLVPGIVRNLSEAGCQVDVSCPQPTGRHLSINVVGLPLIEGWVAWHSGDHHGINLTLPLLPELLASLAPIVEPNIKIPPFASST